MLTDARGPLSAPLAQYDTQALMLTTPNTFNEGAQTGAAVKLPGKGNIMAVLNTGAISSAGSVVSKIQESPDGSTNWVDVYTFPAAGQGTCLKAYLTTTKVWVRHIWTVTGQGGTGSIVVGMFLVF